MNNSHPFFGPINRVASSKDYRLIVQFQTLENYAAHNFEGDSPRTDEQSWKCKGGHDLVIGFWSHFPSIQEQGDAMKKFQVEYAMGRIPELISSHFFAYVITGSRLLLPGELTYDEECQNYRQ